jgi:hypothetical protein
MSFDYDTPFETIEALKGMISDWISALEGIGKAGEPAGSLLYSIEQIVDEMKEAIK